MADRCICCHEVVPDWEPERCCDGTDCCCEGLPIEPCICEACVACIPDSPYDAIVKIRALRAQFDEALDMVLLAVDQIMDGDGLDCEGMTQYVELTRKQIGGEE